MRHPARAGERPRGRLRRRGGAEQRLQHRVAALLVDQHVLAVLAQDLQLLLVAQREALERERRLGPRAIQLEDVHAERKVLHGDLLAQLTHRSL